MRYIAYILLWVYESPLEQDVRTGVETCLCQIIDLPLYSNRLSIRTGLEILLPAKKGGNISERSESPKFIKEESTLFSHNNPGSAGWGQLV